MVSKPKLTKKEDRDPSHLYVSATQLEGFDRCNRYWWFKWGWLGNTLTEPDKGFLTFGTVLHSAVERYLRANALGIDPETKKPVDLYPQGWADKINNAEAQLIMELVKKSIDDGHLIRLPEIEIEVDIEREIAPKIVFTGRVDVFKRDGIEDHKTAKTFKYCLSSEELRSNIQMMCYAMELIRRKHERGEPMPNKIELRHNVYCKDPENKKIKVTKAYVTPAEVVNYWNDVMERLILPMKALRDAKLQHWEEVPGPEDKHKACNAYGGCSFRGICGKSETVDQYRRRLMPFAPVQVTQQQQGPKKMTILDQIKAKKNPTAIPPAATGAPAINASLPKGKSPFAAASAPAAVPSLKPGLPSRAQAESAKRLPVAAAPVEPAPQETQEEGEAQQAPPWAVGTCTACEGFGFTTTGEPCRICDNQRTKARGITSSMFNIDVTEEGASWSPKVECYKQLAELGYSVEDMPEQSDPQSFTEEGEPQVSVAEAPALEFDAPVQTAQVMSPQLIPQRRGPGRPPKNEVNVVGTETSKLQKSSFVLMLGCKARKPESSIIYIEELVASIGMEIAAQSNLKSYYEADIWRRRDALAGCVPMLASRIQGSIVIVNRLTKDNESLVDALAAVAAQVFEADDFYAKAGK